MLVLGPRGEVAAALHAMRFEHACVVKDRRHRLEQSAADYDRVTSLRRRAILEMKRVEWRLLQKLQRFSLSTWARRVRMEGTLRTRLTEAVRALGWTHHHQHQKTLRGAVSMWRVAMLAWSAPAIPPPGEEEVARLHIEYQMALKAAVRAVLKEAEVEQGYRSAAHEQLLDATVKASQLELKEAKEAGGRALEREMIKHGEEEASTHPTMS